MSSNYYDRHNSIQGVEIRINHTSTVYPLSDYSAAHVSQTTTINAWQGRKTTDKEFTPPSPYIEL